MYQAAFNASQASPKKDKKDTNGTANKEKKSSDKKVTAPKKQIPANISQAVKENVRVEDLKNLLETAQTRFPDSSQHQSSCQGECKSRGLEKSVGDCTNKVPRFSTSLVPRSCSLSQPESGLSESGRVFNLRRGPIILFDCQHEKGYQCDGAEMFRQYEGNFLGNLHCQYCT